MKTIPLLLAASAALLAAGAHAQSSVTLFGVVDTGFARDGGSVASVQGMSNGNNASSRIGFRGVEDLGGGLKAGFWLEAGINSDSGGGSTNTSTDNLAASTVTNSLQFGRRATVSLTGNFGEIRLGRDITPAYANELYSPFGPTSVGSDVTLQANLIGQTQLRTSNGIHYFTPNTLGGFYGHLHYAMGEQPSVPDVTSDNGNYMGLRLGFKRGPFDIAVAYGKIDIARTAPAAGVSNDRSVASIVAAYDLGVVKLTGEVQRQKIDNTVNAGFGNAGTLSVGNDTESKGFAIGALIPLGSGSFKVAYSRIEIENGHGIGTEPRAAKFALGYVYDFSKRTAMYTSVARLKNSRDRNGGGTLTAAANRVSGISGAVTGVNTSSTGFEIGVRHSF